MGSTVYIWLPFDEAQSPASLSQTLTNRSTSCEAIDERPPSASRSGLLYTDPRPQKTSGFTAGCHPGKLRHEVLESLPSLIVLQTPN